MQLLEDNDFPKEKFGSMHLNKVEGNFEFKNVSFAYDKNKVLKDLSFKIGANETVAFVGKSGVGKTTHSLLLANYLKDRFTWINGDKPLIRIGSAFLGRICAETDIGLRKIGQFEIEVAEIPY